MSDEPDMDEYEMDISSWFHENDGIGVKLDTLLDAMMQAKNYEHHFSQFNVQFDSLLDSPELLTTEEYSELREMQQRFQHYQSVMNVRKMQMEEELEKVKSRRDEQ